MELAVCLKTVDALLLVLNIRVLVKLFAVVARNLKRFTKIDG
ncbi:hypothetical protein LINGRAHAP2_LOCUS32344 [Linum grandiflorum]